MLSTNVSEPSKAAIVISADHSSSLWQYGCEIYRFRELLGFFIWRDSVVRYKQAFLGAAWVVLRPLITMLLFAFIFGLVARFPTSGVSYPLFVLAGMLPWQLFANTINDTSSSLINHAPLITKAYFPRLLLPLSQICLHMIDFGINLLLLLTLSPLLGSTPTLLSLAFFPLILLWTLFLCIGVALWLAPLAARYRDVRFLVAFFLQFGLFLSPVGYGTSMVPDRWLWLYALNPLVGLIDAYRWCLLSLPVPHAEVTLSFSIVTTGLLFISGLMYFKRCEMSLVDTL